MPFTVKATAIVPKGFDAKEVEQEVFRALVKEGKKDKDEFRKTTEGWSSAPPMAYKPKISSKEASVWIGPFGTEDLVDKWVRIDEGTEPRDIISSTMMVFPFQGRGRSYNPKTRPGWIGSVPGAGQKFGPIRRTKHVKGHKIEPRYWSKTLAARRIGPFAANVQAAVNRGMKP